MLLKAQLYTHLFESFAHGGELEPAVIVLCPATGESDITGPTVSCAFHPFDKTDRRSRRATGEHNRHTCAFLVSERALLGTVTQRLERLLDAFDSDSTAYRLSY